MEAFTGSIVLFAGNFPPRNWAFCDGQLLGIAEHQALYSLLGTTYGGDGHTTFALPDLRGRAPIGSGAGPGLSPVQQGQMLGREATVLSELNMPTHTHNASLHNATVAASSGEGGTVNAADNVPAKANLVSRGGGSDVTGQIYAEDGDTTMKSGSVTGDVQVSPAGSSQPFDNRSPELAMQFIICLNGIYPPHD